jgi:hypothetical protein
MKRLTRTRNRKIPIDKIPPRVEKEYFRRVHQEKTRSIS